MGDFSRAKLLLCCIKQLIGIIGVGFVLILPRAFGLDGVLYSMLVSDALTFLIASVLIYRTYVILSK